MEQIFLHQKLSSYFKNLWEDLSLKKQLVGLLAVILLILVLPTTIYLATHPQIWKPKAASSENVQIYDISSGSKVTITPGEERDVLMVIKDISWK
ncbi:MAG: hypothetical protein HYS80_01420 [Candidatus Aenigmarchaeota archaeon]|nr:hypothetical protein [Candidatus Aenigmarchaeota archaeon]